MVIGVPKEVKDHETRVGVVPSGVVALVEAGHEVLVEKGAGIGSSLPDEEYIAAGAKIRQTAAEVWGHSEMVVKVKEPQRSEFAFLRPNLLLFTYLHLAPEPELTERLVESHTTALAYETVRERDRSLPLLTPMSEVAGRMAVQVGAQYLERPNGGRGLLLSGVPGVAPANVVILGGGVVGLAAAKIAVGMGANVTVIDKNLERLRQLDDIFLNRIATLASNTWTIRESVALADLVIGGVLIPGASAPKLVRREHLKTMRPGAVMVDVAIDQGGCFETSRPTTHTEPVFVEEGIVHYCVTNMPAAVPHTSTLALTNATIPYVLQLANQGFALAVDQSDALREGVNTYRGNITYKGVGQSQGRPTRDLRVVM